MCNWATGIRTGLHPTPFGRDLPPAGLSQVVVALLKTAASAHVGVVKDAVTAVGCDRHLFGLRQLMQAGEAESGSAAIFTDPVFAESGTWKMSTSHLVSDYFDGWGYGEVQSTTQPAQRCLGR